MIQTTIEHNIMQELSNEIPFSLLHLNTIVPKYLGRMNYLNNPLNKFTKMEQYFGFPQAAISQE
jgi:hypothetical protein